MEGEDETIGQFPDLHPERRRLERAILVLPVIRVLACLGIQRRRAGQPYLRQALDGLRREGGRLLQHGLRARQGLSGLQNPLFALQDERIVFVEYGVGRLKRLIIAGHDGGRILICKVHQLLRVPFGDLQDQVIRRQEPLPQIRLDAIHASRDAALHILQGALIVDAKHQHVCVFPPGRQVIRLNLAGEICAVALQRALHIGDIHSLPDEFQVVLRRGGQLP